MAEKKSYVYEIIIDTRSGIATLNGTDVALSKLGSKIRKVQKDTMLLNNEMKGTADASGLASAATVELGRTFSDAGYGIQGVTNNVQQLGSLFTTLMGRKNGKGGVLGFKGAMDLMLTSLRGPLGAIVLFQAVTSAIEYFSRTLKGAKEEVEEFNSTLEPDQRTLQALSLYADTADGLDALKRKFKEVGEFLRNAETTGFVNQEVIEYAKIWGNQLLIARDRIQSLTFALKEEAKQGVKTERLSIDLAKAYADESKALRMLNTEKFKGVEVTAKQNKEKEEELRLTQWEYQDLSSYYDDLVIKTSAVLSAEQQLEFARQKYHLNESFRKATQKRWDEGEFERKMMMMEAIGQGLISLGFLLGKETQAGKGIAAAGALIDTYAAIAGILKNVARTPQGAIPGYAIAQAVATGLFGLAQVKKIYDVRVPGSGGGDGGGGATPEIPQYNPSFNVVGGSRIDQLNDTIRGELGKPARAYVVNKDVRSAGELERNIRNQGTVSG